MTELGKFNRVAVALGGFLIFVGVIMVVASALAFYDFVKIPEGTLLIWFLLVISLLNLIAAILLARNCW
jgi:predicted tellurium resistance membrane protein TerC